MKSSRCGNRGRRVTLIYFFGPDGSGKTTIIKLLRGYLFSRSVRTCASWFRGSHFLASLLARLLSRFAVFRGHDNPYYEITIPSRLRKAWLLIEFFSFLPHYLSRRFLSLFCFVIGDRGVLDFIVWIIVTLRHPKFMTSLLGRFLARLATKDLPIYVTAGPAVLYKRSSNTPHHFLLRELSCYDVLAKNYADYVIDTSDKSPREVLDELLRYLQL